MRSIEFPFVSYNVVVIYGFSKRLRSGYKYRVSNCVKNRVPFSNIVKPSSGIKIEKIYIYPADFVGAVRNPKRKRVNIGDIKNPES
jgi:uncharacterized membrane protein